jgi:hypothetical protein
MAISILIRVLLLLQLPLQLVLSSLISLPAAPTTPTTLKVSPPTTTSGPDALDLKKRQAGQVCGYVNANPSRSTLGEMTFEADVHTADPAWCDPGYQCAVNTFNSAGGCCVNPHCTGGCQQNDFVTRWYVSPHLNCQH